ncbi:glycosyltransferase family 2 protein [Kocuria sp. SL71]|uniref:glycosyltransferase family 2 protein n=1 Tax=Kocuria sp. SL71 TaxID=2995151 RepID=UPI002276DB52|nr:glycosyltransferase family 2 protein [Kocuria sp. SL71]MCY1683389.1 glycosyltransferase family 2 protein [Kocuria sp. SL71]
MRIESAAEVPVTWRDAVTIVIPFYGDPAETLNLVSRLRNSPAPEVAEIVISDDCSPSPFPGTLSERASAAGAQAVSVRVVRRERNGGFGAAVNTGLEQVRTPLALVLNSDLEIEAEQISELVAQAAPWQPVVATAQVLGPQGTAQYSGRHFPTIGHQTIEWLTPLARWRHHRVLHEAVGHDMRGVESTEPIAVDWVMGAVMLLPVAEVRALGGFDEGFHMNSEEVDLQLRLRRIGVASVVIPSVQAVHVGGGSSDPQRRRQWLVDSRFRYAGKWDRPRVLAASLTIASTANFAVNCLRRAAGTPVRPISTLRSELRLIREGIRCA